MENVNYKKIKKNIKKIMEEFHQDGCNGRKFLSHQKQ